MATGNAPIVLTTCIVSIAMATSNISIAMTTDIVFMLKTVCMMFMCLYVYWWQVHLILSCVCVQVHHDVILKDSRSGARTVRMLSQQSKEKTEEEEQLGDRFVRHLRVFEGVAGYPGVSVGGW